MSSTNKTTNYELSQFIGSDKPAWLADYNQDMSKIDAQMKLNADSATGADGKADANTTAIGTLANLTTTVKTDLVSAINEVDASADSANTTANGVAVYIDINNTKANLSASPDTGATVDEIRFHSAYNTGGTLGKIYGYMQLIKTNGQDTTVTLSDTGLRPTTTFTISDGIIMYRFSGDTTPTLFTADLVVNTDGTASFVIPGWTYNSSATTYIRAINQPYVIFAKKFDA